MVSIHRPLGYGPSTLPLRHSAFLLPVWDLNTPTHSATRIDVETVRRKRKIMGKIFGKTDSRGWFRSIDLWVMGPARFRCATLLCLLFYRNLPSLDTNIMNDKMDWQRTGTLRQNAKLSPTLHLHYGQSDVTVDDCRNSRLSDRLPGICRGRTPCESKVCKDKLVAVVGFEPTPPERLEP